MRRNALSLLAPALLLAGCADRELPTGLDTPEPAAPHFLVVPTATPGALVSWGWDTFGQVSNTPTDDDFVAVSAGGDHSVALRSNGSLVSWGRDLEGQVSNTPADNDFVAVAAGGSHSVALRSDSSLASWGDDSDSQVSDMPADNDFMAIAAGGNHSVALRSDGSLVSWGYNSHGQVSNTPADNDIVAIAAGFFHSVALRSNGSLVSWGHDGDGQVSNTPADNDFAAVAAGAYHGVALRSNGSLVSWGWDTLGQVSNTPTDNDFVAIAAGGYHSVALRSDGSLVSWGDDGSGQVSNTPADSDFVAIAARGYHSVAIRVPADLTPPAITPTIGGTLGSNGWYTSDVTVSWSVTDPDSGITSQNGCNATTISADTDGTTLTCEATSAGGTSSESVTIKRDATAPALSPSVSPNPVPLNGSATATPDASDDLSGVASAACGPVNAGSVGAKTLTCTATDNAGNLANADASYSVEYAFDGFASPVSNGGVLNSAKAGQAIPLKWRVVDAAGAPVTTLTAVTVTVTTLACSIGSTPDLPEEYAAGNSGLQNHGNGYYQFNWKTPKSYAKSCKTLHLNLDEGASRTALFEFKK